MPNISRADGLKIAVYRKDRASSVWGWVAAHWWVVPLFKNGDDERKYSNKGFLSIRKPF
jgi:hypothetical protein